MNYFGMVFSFMVPGIVLGAMAAAAVHESAQQRRKERARVQRAMAKAKQRRLYVCNLAQEAERQAA